MPRPKKPGAAEPKTRSRNGCWPCKARKVKCGEEKPQCANCERQGEICDYRIRLNWGGRTKRSAENTLDNTTTPSNSILSFLNNTQIPSPEPPTTPLGPPPTSNHATSHSEVSIPTSGISVIDPNLAGNSQPQTVPGTVAGGSFDQQLYGLDNQRQSFPQPTSFPVESQLQNAQFRGSADYPSPSVSTFDGLTFNNTYLPTAPIDPPFSSPTMLPPIRHTLMYDTRGLRQNSEGLDASTHQYKRQKRSHSPDERPSALSASDAYSPNPGPLTPYSPLLATPLTPGSSVASEDFAMRSVGRHTANPPPDLRRLSVQSILNGPPGENSYSYSSETSSPRQYPKGDSKYTTYGYDMGLPDLDLPRNDDRNAIAIFSPPTSFASFPGDEESDTNGTRSKDIAFEKGGYYAKPVPIKIPKSLEPLPPLLIDNPMNVLYFHHFLNHTARILIPHDCEQNPFRHILPELAMHDENVLNLLLAFSASHRARLLNHPEPANRIAVLVKDVFPKLRQSLIENYSQVSNTTLATSVMLASLEIICPNTFEVPISWQDHLKTARQLILARGGPKTFHRDDRAAYFLSRWFAYLDVVGSLSGNKKDKPLGSNYWTSDNLAADEEYEIDCLLGFTSRCMGILARIAELASQCEPMRINQEGNIREGWEPSEDVIEKAEQIRKDLYQGLSDHTVYKGCNHKTAESSEAEAGWDATEVYATNEMFHWAGLIHLDRRVFGKQQSDWEVQKAVSEISRLLYKVRKGSSAEACLLFPMFTAGCDAIDSSQREKIMERLKVVEGFGMTQIHKARNLMQRVWDTGKPWEALVSGEFFG